MMTFIDPICGEPAFARYEKPTHPNLCHTDYKSFTGRRFNEYGSFMGQVLVCYSCGRYLETLGDKYEVARLANWRPSTLEETDLLIQQPR